MLEHYVMGSMPPQGPVIPFRQNTSNNFNSLPDGTISIKQESDLLECICARCNTIISDRYLLRVNERNYHEECVACSECSAPLSKSCFTRDCKLYCREDYDRLYRSKCARCNDVIGCKELVMKLPGQVFHVDCFACIACGQILLRGAHYVIRHGQPLCRREFESEMAYLNSPQDDDLLDENRCRGDGRRGPKRPRTILTSVQRRQFKASFEVSPKPCRKVREALAKETGLSVRVVQVWFQNQRAKMKKLQRKAKTEPDKEAKEERKTESPHSDHSHYINAMKFGDGESSNFPSSTQPLNPNNPYSPEDAYGGHSNESFCSSDLSIDGTEAGFDIGDSENGNGADNSHHGNHASLISSFAATNQDLSNLSQSLHSAMHNPIDKLCMMQSSYFTADHV